MNKAERKEYQRQWRAKHPEYNANWSKAHRDANPGYEAEKVRRYREAHPGQHSERVRKWKAINAEKYQAHNAVHLARERGELIRLVCEICGNPKSHAHHTDYSKPLEVKWLCALCHKQAHQ